MTAWKRWQDYATLVLGVLVFLSPFAFGATSHTNVAVAAYVLGVLLVLAGVLDASRDTVGGTEYIPIVLGVILFASPWLFGFAGMAMMAYTAWVIGILVVLAVGSELYWSRAGHRVG